MAAERVSYETEIKPTITEREYPGLSTRLQFLQRRAVSQFPTSRSFDVTAGRRRFVTPKRGERVDPGRPTQVGRALQELRIKMIPAYSPQARGRIERSPRIMAGYSHD